MSMGSLDRAIMKYIDLNAIKSGLFGRCSIKSTKVALSIGEATLVIMSSDSGTENKKSRNSLIFEITRNYANHA